MQAQGTVARIEHVSRVAYFASHEPSRETPSIWLGPSVLQWPLIIYSYCTLLTVLSEQPAGQEVLRHSKSV